MESTDQAVLGAVERDVLRVEVLETSLWKGMNSLLPSAEVLDDRGRRLRDELARLDTEVSRLAAAIAADGELGALIAALQERERRRTYLRAEMGALERTAVKREADDLAGILDQFRNHLTDWQGMLRQEPPAACQALQALLKGRLIFTRHEDSPERYYAFEGPGTLRPVIVGLAFPKGVVTPAGRDKP